MGRKVIAPQRRELRMRIARACKMCRMECGYTQQQVADECHVTKTDIAYFERGDNDSATIYQWYIDKGVKVTNA